MPLPATCPRPAVRLWTWLGFLLLLLSSSRLYAYDVTVAKDGTGNYTTISAAVAAAPTGRTAVYTIYIKDGIYSEKVNVPSTKPFLQFVGQSVANTILTWNDNALTSDGAGGTVGTGGSGSIIVRATDFSALNMTFINSFGDGSQAVAVSLYADRAAFKNCRFLGNQDTLLTFESNGAVSRHYFRDCYIDGNVDFIFGSAIAIFDNCTIYAKTRVVTGSTGTSYITAANTQSTQQYGYLFRNARIPSNNGTTLYYLGRPWQNSTGFSTAAGTLANNKVVFMKTKVGVNEIQPAGWVIWDSGTDVTKITDAEYRTTYFNGNRVNVSARVSWSQQLAPADTVQYTLANLFGTGTGTGSAGGTAVPSAWNPTSLDASFGTYRAPDIAVSNLQATKGSTQTALSWNISWAMSGIQYALQRSSDNVNFSTINTQTAATDSLYNFAATDALPAAGSAYYYRVVASKSGLTTHTTPSVQVSSIPTITASTASLTAFTQYNGGPSAAQTYTVSAANLTDNLTITPPAGFEVSANAGTNWYTSTTPLVLTPTSNTVASTTISVRLNTATVGSGYGGNVAHTSSGATTVNVAVTGSRVNGTALQSDVLQYWPLIRNNNDSTQVRSTQLQASQPTLKSLFLSNGTTVTTIPAYSTKWGQAMGASVDGSGSWALVGGTPKRNYYEQFQVKTTASGAVRIDSLVLTSAFYNTSSNTKLVVSYSKSAFVSDSAEVTGATGPGTSSSAYGTFAAPIPLANQTNGPTNVYHLALNGSTGVNLTAGQTLTIRLYNSCGSSSAGRYNTTKNVLVKGAAVQTCNAAFSYAATAYCRTGTNPTPTVTGTTGGTFSSTTGLTIDASTGTINLSGSTAGTYTVTYTASAGCTSTQTVTVTAPPTANIGYGAASYCTTTTTGTVALGIGTGSTLGTITVNPATGLTFAANGAITPSTSTPGTYFVTNTVAASGGCAAVTGGTTVTIAAPATAGFSYSAGPFCVSGTTNPTATLATGATAGTFTSTTGLTLNATTGAITLSSSTPGTYTVTNTVAASGGCAAVTSTASVIINAAPTAGFSYSAGPFCVSGGTNPTATLTSGATAGTFTSTTGLTLNASTGAITLSSSTPGTYTVTNTVAASGGCAAVTSTATVVINAAPTAGFSYSAGPFCVSGATNPTATLATGATAGTFSAPTGLTLNATTGAITLSSSTPGTYTVTNTVAASGGCAAVTSTASVIINAAPTAGFSYGAGPFCVSGSTNPTATLTSGATAGTFASTTGLTLNASTGAITLSSSTPGNYTVTNTVAASGGCAAVTSTASVTIAAAPTAGFSYTAPAAGGACAGGTGTVAPALATGATAGTFSSTAGLSVNASTGVISLAGSAAGTYTVTNTVAASGGCAAVTSTATFTVNAVPATPTITVTGTPGTGITLTSSAATGNQFYRNNVAITGATGPSYIVLSGAGNGSYTVTVTNASGCSATSAATAITVTATAPTATGANLTLYPNPTPDGRLTLELAGYREAVQLTVVNALGQVVYTGLVPAGASTHALDLSGLARGVYMLQGRTASGEQLVRRLVRD